MDGGLRRINPQDFRVATQKTSRDINRLITLNLIREHQPISRADLARRMDVRRGVVSVLVNELIADELVYEGATGEAARGRKPTFLHIRTKDRLVVAVDVRFSKTYLMLSDFGAYQIALEIFNTNFKPEELVQDVAIRVNRLLEAQDPSLRCEGLGLAVPGMVDRETGRILNAPALGWRDIDIKESLEDKTGLPVYIENAAKACALAQMWLGKSDLQGSHNFAYVSVSDGVGVGLVLNGELVRGHNNIAGEFGHTPLSIDGPECMCGNKGCWEAYISNISTLARYFGQDLAKMKMNPDQAQGADAFTINDLISRARLGDSNAMNALKTTAYYLGVGLATIVNGLNPECVFLGGEITSAWDLLEAAMQEGLSQRALTQAAAETPVYITPSVEYPRLRGAAALVAAPVFAAPRIA